MTFRTFSHADVERIVVRNFGSGSISVIPCPADTVEGALNAMEGELLEATQIQQRDGDLRFLLPERAHAPNAHLRLEVPPGRRVDITALSAEVSVTALLAESEITTVSGDIDVDRAHGLTCTTGSGAVRVRQVLGDRATRLASESGDVVVEQAGGPLQVRSGNGNVVVRSLSATLQATSGAGAISVPWTAGSVELRSSSGSVTVGLAGHLAAALDLGSVTGRVRTIPYVGSHLPGQEPRVSVHVRTITGEIVLYRA